MSLKVIKAGIQDTLQDLGRYGYQWLGINPGGAMDPFASRIANMLVDNAHEEAVLEMHFPAAAFLFEKDCLIALGGANFSSNYQWGSCLFMATGDRKGKQCSSV